MTIKKMIALSVLFFVLILLFAWENIYVWIGPSQGAEVLIVLIGIFVGSIACVYVLERFEEKRIRK